jgi:cullin-associated NEDD8-dissociated protein 1
LPQALRGILKQLSLKSSLTRQECFVILRQIAEILGGGLDSDANAICSAAATALRSVDSATTSSLAIAALSFLAVFFKHHSARAYAGHINDLVPAIVHCLKDKLLRINFEAFAAASALAQSIRPKGSASPLPNNFSQPVHRIFTATTEVLADTSVDGDVRERALETLGSLLVHEGDALASSYSVCLPLITARLANETTASTAVLVIGKVAESPTCTGSEFEKWLLDVLPDVVVALRRSRRVWNKNAEFACLQYILTRVGSTLPAETARGIVAELQPFIDTPTALQVVALILAQQPACRPVVEKQLAPQVMEVIKTPSVNLHLVDALASFFAAYVDGDIDCATRLVPALVDNLGKAGSLPDATAGGTSTYTTTARCIGVVVEHSQRNAAGVLAVFQKTIKVSKVGICTAVKGGVNLSERAVSADCAVAQGH